MGRNKVRTHRNIKKNAEGLKGAKARAALRRRRRRIVAMQRLLIASIFLIVIGGGGFAIVWNLPEIKRNRQLHAGQAPIEVASYNEAIESYEKALKIDSTSVKAYRYMAKAYFDMEDEANAKQILYEGWENTQDEGLFQYYCTTILNEAVSEINNNNSTWETMQKIVSVLEKDAENKDAIELLHTAYTYFIQKLSDESNTTLFFDEDIHTESCDFHLYEQLMNQLFEIYNNNQTDDIKQLISKCSMIDINELRISRQHLSAYKKILEDTQALLHDDSRSELLKCMEKEEEIQNTFAKIFKEFDAGNYEAAKDFIVTDNYTQIRDQFINGTMEYWNGATYIPINREAVIFKQTEGRWTFEFSSFKDNENTAGIITVWGNKMTDEGIQRSCIAYEPRKESDNYYPHVEYVISYMNSNVQKKNAFVTEMNYHLETRTWTEEGMITVMIGDWGGPYQWEKTY